MLPLCRFVLEDVVVGLDSFVSLEKTIRRF